MGCDLRSSNIICALSSKNSIHEVWFAFKQHSLRVVTYVLAILFMRSCPSWGTSTPTSSSCRRFSSMLWIIRLLTWQHTKQSSVSVSTDSSLNRTVSLSASLLTTHWAGLYHCLYWQHTEQGCITVSTDNTLSRAVSLSLLTTHWAGLVSVFTDTSDNTQNKTASVFSVATHMARSLYTQGGMTCMNM